MAEPRETAKLRVFISYSRDDLVFADQLDAALGVGGFATIIDRHGISGGEEWKLRLGALIREADTVAFVLSPASAGSSICAWEVDEAVKLGKRIIPVLCRPLEEVAPPSRLQGLNYIFFYPEPKSPGSGFGTGLVRLVEALNTDLDWIRDHTRYLQRASEWDAGSRPPNRLLSGSDIGAAKTWAAQRPRGAPEPTTLHLDFIRASEEVEAARASTERQRLDQMRAAQDQREKALLQAQTALRRVQRAQTAVGALLVSVIVGIFAWSNETVLTSEWNWYMVMRPYMNANVRPHVLTLEAERALKTGQTFRECAKDCPEMVVVPAGSFMIGSPQTEKGRYDDEGPQRKITIAKPFVVAKFDVTFADWDACVSVGGCPPISDSGIGRGTKPVINVNWEEAKKYVAWLARMTGKPYRLLTEAEWEYAARAGTTTAYP